MAVSGVSITKSRCGPRSACSDSSAEQDARNFADADEPALLNARRRRCRTRIFVAGKQSTTVASKYVALNHSTILQVSIVNPSNPDALEAP